VSLLSLYHGKHELTIVNSQQAYRNRQGKYIAELEEKLAAAKEECKLHEEKNVELQQSLSDLMGERRRLSVCQEIPKEKHSMNRPKGDPKQGPDKKRR
jgi:hypothetical protein